jgi:hypothetical protein
MFRPQHHGDRMHPCNNSNLPGQRTTVSHRRTIAVLTHSTDKYQRTIPLTCYIHPQNSALLVNAWPSPRNSKTRTKQTRAEFCPSADTDIDAINSCIIQHIPTPKRYQHLQLPLQCHVYIPVSSIKHAKQIHCCHLYYKLHAISPLQKMSFGG